MNRQRPVEPGIRAAAYVTRRAGSPRGMFSAAARGKRGAFTLVELLVVIAILCLLLTILVPSLKRAKEIARRAICASNLHQWGLAIGMYTTENRDRVLETPLYYDGRYPCVFFVHKTTHPNEWSVEALDPYLRGVSWSAHHLGDLWRCPSFSMAGDFDSYENAYWDDGRDLVHTNYSIYTRADLWSAHATRPQDLVATIYTATGVLATDMVYQWWVGGWSYGHGRGGPSIHLPVGNMNCRRVMGPPNLDLEGYNRLFGAGNVQWKDMTNVDPLLLQNRDPSLDIVSGGGGSSLYDATYY